MKKIWLLVLIVVFIGAVTSFVQKSVSDRKEEVPSFSYAEELEEYDRDTQGIKYDGFNNTFIYEVKNEKEAVERAKKGMYCRIR